jgi:hypothetical protein
VDLVDEGSDEAMRRAKVLSLEAGSRNDEEDIDICTDRVE